MKTLARWLAAVLIPVSFSAAALAEGFIKGVNYLELANPQPTSSGERIEVVELFWYGCPHCYHLEPYVGKWLETKPDDVEFVRMPAIVSKKWELLARGYYTAELLGVLDTVHEALFETLHDKKRKINNEEDLRRFFVEQGVSVEDFDKTFKSFAVQVKVNNARQMTRRYAITGVPSVIVNGKYSTSGRYAGSTRGILNVVDYLVELERGQVAAGEAAGAATN